MVKIQSARGPKNINPDFIECEVFSNASAMIEVRVFASGSIFMRIHTLNELSSMAPRYAARALMSGVDSCASSPSLKRSKVRSGGVLYIRTCLMMIGGVPNGRPKPLEDCRCPALGLALFFHCQRESRFISSPLTVLCRCGRVGLICAEPESC